MSVEPASIPAPPLPSRLAPPWRRTDPVARPRLLQRLTSAADAPVFALRAPAGYGKSTLLAQVVAAEHRPVAWLALDEGDDDPTVFVHDLAHALREVIPMPDDVLAGLTPSPAAIVPVGVPRLLRWLADAGTPVVIVLDDVHHLLGQETRDVVRALCDGAPPGVTLVLAGRAKPPIALARLRTEGRLSELGASDLRMTPAEGTAMLQAAGADVDAAEGALVVERTEGWPAAIYLAALMLRGDREGFAAEELGPAEADLSDYFREEVLAAAHPGDVDFLMRSSILDELEADVCDEVLERSDSAERLHALADADLFVSAADAQGQRFRVHGLFREILEGQLRVRRGGEVTELHRRASAAYAERGDAERAVRHAVATGDLALAGERIWPAAVQAVPHGRSATVLRWRAWFSDEQVAAHPLIALAEGWAALELGDAERTAHAAALVAAADPAVVAEDGTPLRLHGRLLRATLGEQGTAAALADAQAAADGFVPGSPIRGIALFLLGVQAVAAGELARAAELLAEAEGLTAGALPTAYSLALSQQAILVAERGDWEVAESLSSRASAFQRSSGIGEYATQGLVTAVQALIEAHAGRQDAARRCAERAARNLALQGTMNRWLGLQTRLVLARTWMRVGEAAHARALLAEVRPVLERDPLALLCEWAEVLEHETGRTAAAGEGAVLTSAELRTLQYLPTHLSLREIGERLYVTRNTVKTHTISIYRKLEVTSRSEAVARARELGLLDA